MFFPFSPLQECLKCCTEAHSSHEYVPLDDAAPKLRAVIGGLNEKANKAAEEAREQAQALEQEKQKLKDSYEGVAATPPPFHSRSHSLSVAIFVCVLDFVLYRFQTLGIFFLPSLHPPDHARSVLA